MTVVIVGCGRMGAQLAALLSFGGHEVVVIDQDPRAFENLSATFNGKKIVGIGFDREILRQASIERSDALVSMTNSDNTNLVVALVARREFQVPKIVTRVYDPERAEIYRRFGIPTISASTWAANETLKMIIHADLLVRLTLGNGEVEIIEVELPFALIGKKISELTVPGEILLTAILRQGKALVPFPGTKFIEGDVLYLAVLSSAMSKFKKLSGLI